MKSREDPAHNPKLRSFTPAWLVVLPLVLAGCLCGSKTQDQANQQKALGNPQSVQGGVAVGTFNTSGTAQGIDLNQRWLALRGIEGRIASFRVGPSATNLNLIHIGDRVNAVLTEELACLVVKGVAIPIESTTIAVAQAPKGANWSSVVVNTVDLSGRVVSASGQERWVSLQLPNGQAKRLKLDKAIDLTGISPGDPAVVRATECIAIALEKL